MTPSSEAATAQKPRSFRDMVNKTMANPHYRSCKTEFEPMQHGRFYGLTGELRGDSSQDLGERYSFVAKTINKDGDEGRRLVEIYKGIDSVVITVATDIFLPEKDRTPRSVWVNESEGGFSRTPKYLTIGKREIRRFTAPKLPNPGYADHLAYLTSDDFDPSKLRFVSEKTEPINVPNPDYYERVD